MVPAVQHRDASIGGGVTEGAQVLFEGVTKPDAMGVASSKSSCCAAQWERAAWAGGGFCNRMPLQRIAPQLRFIHQSAAS